MRIMSETHSGKVTTRTATGANERNRTIPCFVIRIYLAADEAPDERSNELAPGLNVAKRLPRTHWL